MLPARLVRRLDAVALVGGIAAALVLGGAAAPVAVASAHVLVSADGIHFSPTLAGGLFDGRRMLVPGHSVSAELWVTGTRRKHLPRCGSVRCPTASVTG